MRASAGVPTIVADTFIESFYNLTRLGIACCRVIEIYGVLHSLDTV